MSQKIFGIGLNKTGTATFGACMRTLGYRHREHRPGSRRRMLIKYRKGDLREVYSEIDQYDSFEDWPYPLIFRELLQRYGHCSKFVLTVRLSGERWLESLKRHSLTTSPREHCRKLAYGYDYPHGNERAHLIFYEEHNRGVANFFRERKATNQLVELCWERGDGWRELCSFLGVPIPSAPFPRLNESGEKLAAASAEHIIENIRLACRGVDRRQLRN